MNTERKLVTVRKIDSIEQITRKDGQTPKCEIAVLGGWKAMVMKDDNFKPGELVVFAETDSVFPVEARWSFLEKCNYTIKTRKHNNMMNSFGEPIMSQGLVLKLDVLGSGNWAEGDDVTEKLGVTHAPEAEDPEDQFSNNAEFETSSKPRLKWVPGYNKLMRYQWFRKLSLPRKPDKGFPKEVSKTDEERVQNLPTIMQSDTTWTLTEKVDGTSSTFMLKRTGASLFARLFLGAKKFEFIVCTRNHPVGSNGGGVQWVMAKKYKVREAMEKLIGNNKWICLQGESAGPKIQKNPLALKENVLYIFNFITPTGRLKSVDGKSLLEPYGINWVPILETGVNLKDKTAADLLNMANGMSAINPERRREGIVFRAENPNCNLSFKAVSPIYEDSH